MWLSYAKTKEIFSEERKDIPWYEWIYKISNYWNIKSLNYNKTKTEKLLSKQISNCWYEQVHLYKKWIHKLIYVHRLVLKSFIWSSDLDINHIDWNKLNNNIANLEYCTKSYNIKEAFRLWLKESPKYWNNKKWKNHCRSKRVWRYDLQDNLIDIFDWLRDAFRITWIQNSEISKVISWKRKSAWWYLWKFI